MAHHACRGAINPKSEACCLWVPLLELEGGWYYVEVIECWTDIGSANTEIPFIRGFDLALRAYVQ